MKILLAADGSPCSDEAVAEVARRPWPSGTEVRLITVDPPLRPTFAGVASISALDELVDQQRAEAAKKLKATADTLRERAPALTVLSFLREGSPREAILNEAEQWGADLIVLGSHGYGSVRRFFLGSVSLAVAANAACSVLIVRAPAANPTAG